MKTLFRNIAVILLISATSAGSAQKVYNLSENSNGEHFTCTAHPNEKSTHYLKAIRLVIENTSNVKIIVRIENGLMLMAADTGNQDFVVTREELISLDAGKKREVEIYSACTESYNSVPDSGNAYSVGKLAGQQLAELTRFIESQKYYGLQEAQQAIWALCNNKPLENITGYDTAACRKLIGKVSAITGRPVPPPPSPDDYAHNYYSSNLRITVGGAFNYEFNYTAHIRIALFNKNNIVVRELYNNPSEKPGEHRFEYEFDASVYTDDLYYIRFIVNDEVWASGEMDLRERD